MNLKGMIKKSLKRFAMKHLNISAPYEFKTAKSIRDQIFHFECGGKIFEISADYTTPLYETIAEIVDNDCYQLKSMEFIGAKEQIILDIGANVGVSALVLSRIKNARIYCFEPLPENCARIEENVRKNSVNDVKIISKAVAKTDGKILLEMIPDQSVSARIPLGGQSTSAVKAVEVEAISMATILDTLNIKTIDLIKIDCEGGEYDIIDQIDISLAQRIRYISLEVHDISPNKNFRNLSKQLQELGYRLKYNPEVFGRAGLNHLLAFR